MAQAPEHNECAKSHSGDAECQVGHHRANEEGACLTRGAKLTCDDDLTSEIDELAEEREHRWKHCGLGHRPLMEEVEQGRSVRRSRVLVVLGQQCRDTLLEIALEA